MKKNYILQSLCICLLLIGSQELLAQSTETFDGETAGSTSFTDNGQTFNVTSETGEGYNIFLHGFNDPGSGGANDSCTGCGWNGSAPDNQFLDNTGNGNNNGQNNGTSFTIKPAGTINIEVSSLYLFCSTKDIGIHSGTLTITRKRDNIEQFIFTKSSGFANPTTFTPNNGFTLIDFSTEGGSDNSSTPIDELIISGSGNLDYLALDAFTWTTSALSINKVKNSDIHEIYPNPTTDYINVSNIKNKIAYRVYDILGKNLKNGLLESDKNINVKDFSKGIYFLQFESGETFKFIKR